MAVACTCRKNSCWVSLPWTSVCTEKRGPAIVPCLQSILGSKSYSQGYPNIQRSRPILVTKKVTRSCFPPCETRSSQDRVMVPDLLRVPSIFATVRSTSSFLVPKPSLLTVEWSMKFPVAPLSTSAFSSALPLFEWMVNGISIDLFCPKYTFRRRRALTTAVSFGPSKNPPSCRRTFLFLVRFQFL